MRWARDRKILLKYKSLLTMIFTAMTYSIFTMHMTLLRKMGPGNEKLHRQKAGTSLSENRPD